MIVVSDTSPVANLLLINKLFLLEELFKEVIIPPAVDKEILALQSIGRIGDYTSSRWIKVIQPKDKDKVSHLLTKLDKGEAEAIVLTEELHADLLLIDERIGAAEANRKAIRTIGLLAVLILAKQKGFINEIKPLITNLKQEGFWISEKLISKVLISANKL